MPKFIVLFLCSFWLQAGPVPALPAGSAEPEVSAPLPRVREAYEGEDLAPYLKLAASAEARSGVAELKRALTLWKTGNASGAVKTFERAAGMSPGLADWARALGADAAAASGDTITVRRLLAETEPVLAREWGWRAIVNARKASGDLPGAIEAALAASDALGEASRRAEAARMTGDLFLLRRDTLAAILQYRRAIDMAPQTSAAVDAARALSALPALRPEDHGRIGRVYLRHGNLDRGIAALDRYLASPEGSADQRAQARLDIGRALFDARRYELAERRLLALGHEAASPAIAAEALLLVGRAQYRLGRADAARVSFAMTAERFAGERAAAEALFILGDLEHDQSRLATARSYYRRAMAGDASGDVAADAAMRLGGIAFGSGDVLESALLFEEFRSRHRGSKRYVQATFWAGRAYLTLGDTLLGKAHLREVRQLEPASYYGMRAAELLGDPAWHTALPAPPETGEATRLETTGALRRLDVLAELGLSHAKAFEMERLKRHFGPSQGALYVFAETLHDRKEMLAAIRLGREIQRIEGQWNERLLRIVYPFPYRDAIVREARRRGVDPYLAAGIVRQESLFDPKAVSGAGAIGLMQVMPQTGRRLGSTLGIKSVTARTLRTPDVNIRIGMLYLSDLLKRYSGHTPYMLAAYNAGPSRVARWRTQAEAADPDLFAERIPFDETRDYVKIVQQNARVYRALYAE